MTQIDSWTPASPITAAILVAGLTVAFLALVFLARRNRRRSAIGHRPSSQRSELLDALTRLASEYEARMRAYELRVGANEREWTLAEIAELERVHGQCLGRPVLDLSSLYEREGISLNELRSIIDEYLASEGPPRPEGATISELVGTPLAERAANDARAMLAEGRWRRPFLASDRRRAD